MPTFTVTTGSSTARTLTGSEGGIITQNGALAVTSGVAITGSTMSNGNIAVLGSVSTTSGRALSLNGTSASVFVGQNGAITADPGNWFAISASFTSEFTLINHGAIFGARGLTGSGAANVEIFNTGILSGGDSNAIIWTSASSVELYNSGEIFSVGAATISTSNNADIVVNTGSISGSTNLNSGDDYFNGISGMQASVDGGGGNDIIYTGSGIEDLFGGAGNDRMFGNGGGDAFYGGLGDDVMRGGAEADDFDGGDGDDTVYYQNSSAGVTVDLATGFGFGGHAEGDTYTSIEEVRGSAFRDELNGDNGNNYMVGGNGNDVLRGASGNDQFRGDAGADVMNGGTGFDRLVYSASNAAVNVNLTTGNASGGHATGDVFFNMERLTGSQFNDTLTGSTAGNQLFGLNGDDTIRGYLGNDLMNGGGGADTFVFDNNGGNDIIVGFENDVDKLDLSVYGYASAAQVLANTTVSGVDVFITYDANDSIRLVGFAANVGDLSDDLIL